MNEMSKDELVEVLREALPTNYERAAVAAMMGLLARRNGPTEPVEVARMAAEYADALMDQLP